MALNTNALKKLFAGYAPNSVTTEYTAPTGKQAILRDIWVNNTDSSATHTITIRVVTSGQSSSAAYDIVTTLTLGKAATSSSPPQAVNIQCNTILNAGDFIDIVADAASKVSVRLSGVEIG